jgi:Uma2 family endonuclease
MACWRAGGRLRYNRTVSTTHQVTADELLNMPGDQRRELVRGELRMMAPAGFDHGAIIHNFQMLLGRHVAEHRLGVVVGAETGFHLARDPDTVRGADVAFVKAQRIPSTGRPTSYWDGAPDLAVEVLSPTDTVEQIEEKVDDYINAGCPMILVLNPKRRTGTVYRPSCNPLILRENDCFDAQDIIPGFRCALRDIFA